MNIIPHKIDYKIITLELTFLIVSTCLFIKWHLIRLGGHAHGIVTKTVHKTLPRGSGGSRGRWVGECRGSGVQGVGGVGGCGVYRGGCVGVVGVQWVGGGRVQGWVGRWC